MVVVPGHGAASLYGPATALVVVDLQNDFAHPDGSLFVRGGEQVVVVANREIEAARAAGAKVAYTQDWHPPVTPHFAEHGGTWPVHCVRGTWGAAFADGLLLAGEVVRKATGPEDGYSGFTVRHPTSGQELPTRLGSVLHALGVRTVVVIGLATDYCVRDTAADAVALGFDTVVLEEAVAAVELDAGDGARALRHLASVGVAVR